MSLFYVSASTSIYIKRVVQAMDLIIAVRKPQILSLVIIYFSSIGLRLINATPLAPSIRDLDLNDYAGSYQIYAVKNK